MMTVFSNRSPGGLKAHFSKRQSALAGRIAEFQREEDGTLTVFGVMILILIIIVGGIGVDVMRFEQVRTRVQNTEDTAVLAASNLNQTLDAESVVRDYFKKAGLTDNLKSVTVVSSATSRKVIADAETQIKTHFMKLANVDTLVATAASTAEESIGNVEISLVLDNSGSMDQNIILDTTTSCTTSSSRRRGGKYTSCRTVNVTDSKINVLIGAATDFVTSMFASVDPGALTMSIIPYDSHVNLGPDLISRMTVSNEQTAANCIDLLPADFTTTTVDPGTLMQRSGHFNGQSTQSPMTRPECTTAANRQSIAFSNNESDLKNVINAMTAGGYTSIESGVKWGAALLDPAMNPVVNSMIDDGLLDTSYSDRPSAFGDRTHMKVLVVMSDGENTQRYQLNPGYYAGPSGVYDNSLNSSDYSFYDASKGSKPYFWTVDGKWHDQVFKTGAGTYQSCSTSWSTTICTTQVAAGDAKELSYPELWARMSVDYFTGKIIGPAYGSSSIGTWYNKIVNSVSSSQMDGYLHSICSAAKKQGILIYTIGFQTTSHGAATLEDCATDASYYFDVQGTEIKTAFAAIASSIVRLRLTQ